MDGEKSWRLERVLSFLEPKPGSETVAKNSKKQLGPKKHWNFQAVSAVPFKTQILNKFPERNKILPYIKTEMCVSDLDVLIALMD